MKEIQRMVSGSNVGDVPYCYKNDSVQFVTCWFSALTVASKSREGEEKEAQEGQEGEKRGKRKEKGEKAQKKKFKL